MNKNIKKTPEDMDLSRAVPSMPPSFRRRIIETCENLPERQPVSLRRGSIAAAAVFAAVLLLVLAVGFQRPDSFPDAVTPLTQTATNETGDDNSNGHGNAAAPAENTPSEPLSDETVYFFRDGGKWYHTDRTCMGMKDADHGPLEEAQQNGRTACPVCIAPVGSTPEEPAENTPSEPVESTPSQPTPYDGFTYYFNYNSEYYHLDHDCQDEHFALSKPLYLARANHRTACPVCIPSFGAGDNHVFYMTDEGAFFHLRENCMGMRNAVTVNARKIISDRRPACPDCVPGAFSSFIREKDGDLLHLSIECLPDEINGISSVSVAEAVQMDETAFCPDCTVCFTVDVLLTQNGYFHRDFDCKYTLGSNRTLHTSYLEALAYMYSPCPACAVYFAPGESTLSEPPQETKAETYYYSDARAVYYHSDLYCQGMKSPRSAGISELNENGLKPCPICIGTQPDPYFIRDGYDAQELRDLYNNAWPFEHSVYMADGKTGQTFPAMVVLCEDETIDPFYHVQPDICPVWKNEDTITTMRASAIGYGRTLCLECAPQRDLEIPVWLSEGGECFHKQQECGGETLAIQATLEKAVRHYGISALCPECFGLK